jgi:hypothetical protein
MIGKQFLFEDRLMAWNYYFKDRSGAQNGPVTLDELIALAKAGRVAPDCLVWAEGGEAVQAAKHPALAATFAERAPAVSAGGFGQLQPHFPVWGLFWRSIVASIGICLLVTAPWAGLWIYRWFVNQIALPNGRRLSLDSEIGKCWWIFVGLGLIQVLPRLAGGGPGDAGAVSPTLPLAVVLFVVADIFLNVQLLRWLAGSVRSEDGALRVEFEGSYLGYLGWSLVIVLSFITIIGWAWAFKYFTRWIWANVRGSHSFEFVASGWDILWRVLVGGIGCAFILPIPWVIRWLTNWYFSQVIVTPSAQNPALGLRAA